MKLKHFLLGLLTFTLSTTLVQSQDIEGGIMVGITEYQGDLSTKAITWSQSKLSLGALGRYYFSPRFNVKGGFFYGSVEGDDQNNAVGSSVYKRNLNFKSTLLELSAQGELNILPYISNSRRYRFAPYIFGGVGVFHFNPMGQDRSVGGDNKYYALQPLKTEGSTYSLWSLCIPYGVGVKYSLGKFWNLGIEFGQRKLFSDKLDDVSGVYVDPSKTAGTDIAKRMSNMQGKPSAIGRQRGNSKKEDMYLFMGLTLTKTIRRFSCSNF
ncbi:MAG: DUF6089 family protein [Bacteroidetes bacterium]|nr:DUF6089 family protein [Bacteroidota bacterium]